MFFVSADSKRLKKGEFVSAEAKGLASAFFGCIARKGLRALDFAGTPGPTGEMQTELAAIFTNHFSTAR
jgi:hypothetical protein